MHPSKILIVPFSPGEMTFATALTAWFGFGPFLSSIMQHIKRISHRRASF
jgi:hypothetical protein